MKRVNVRFESEHGREDIDVLFTASEMDDQIATLMNHVTDPLSTTWEVRDEQGASVTLPEECIAIISVESKRLRVVADDGTYWLKMPLQDAEKALNPSMFMRVSRYEIINLHKVRRFDFTISGTLRVEMEDGTETWASRRFIPAIKERLQKRELAR
jgi:DNA-binding LytR/AlgR family response regulator